ncbi:hypothetical protein H4R35_002553 [Dimargaris xerosporica]|nr:hypothetical protein H4R35_002553 [Dimargaris xerosporica]
MTCQGNVRVLVPRIAPASLTKALQLQRRWQHRLTDANPIGQGVVPVATHITCSFYRLVALAPDRMVHLQRQWDRQFRSAYAIRGRVYIAPDGINGQIMCPRDHLDDLKDYIRQFPEFQELELNEAVDARWSFSKLLVTIRQQVVRDGVPWTKDHAVHQPEYLSPVQWHDELGRLPASALLVDMRNNYESEVGHFQGALQPDAVTFAEEVDQLQGLTRNKKNDPIYMYCTGGIRCSKAGAILKSQGYQQVKILAGGITAYGRFIQKTGLSSRYVGKNFTFDERLGEAITPDVLTTCYQCGTACDAFTNCASTHCNSLFIQCPTCAQRYHHTCADPRCLDHVHKDADPAAGAQSQPTRWSHKERVHPTKVRKRIAAFVAATQSA